MPTASTPATGEYEDLVKAGVIDAAKVTRSALQNAASIAALFLTTEAVIADKPEPAAAARWHARWHARHGRDGRLLERPAPHRHVGSDDGAPFGAPHSSQLVDSSTVEVHDAIDGLTRGMVAVVARRSRSIGARARAGGGARRRRRGVDQDAAGRGRATRRPPSRRRFTMTIARRRRGRAGVDHRRRASTSADGKHGSARRSTMPDARHASRSGSSTAPSTWTSATSAGSRRCCPTASSG